MWKAPEKYIKNNGLHQVFPEPVIYGPATIKQKKNGKYMKRCFEANTTSYAAQFCLYIESFVSFCPLIEKELQEGLANAAVVMKNFAKERERCNLIKPSQSYERPGQNKFIRRKTKA